MVCLDCVQMVEEEKASVLGWRRSATSILDLQKLLKTAQRQPHDGWQSKKFDLTFRNVISLLTEIFFSPIVYLGRQYDVH